MQASQLQPAGTFAAQFGVKSICYGPPGSGKTPLINTAPRPVLLAVEPGLLSMRGSTVPTWMATTPAQIDEFMTWLIQSPEAKNFDTVGIDSGSELCEIILREELSKKSKSGNKVDGKAAYGEMATRAYRHFNDLYYMREKHVYMICKQGNFEENNSIKRRPYFPGQDLNVKMPHLYDLIMHLDTANVPNVGAVKALRTVSSYDITARDRGGKCAEFEQPNLTLLFNKIVQG